MTYDPELEKLIAETVSDALRPYGKTLSRLPYGSNLPEWIARRCAAEVADVVTKHFKKKNKLKIVPAEPIKLEEK